MAQVKFGKGSKTHEQYKTSVEGGYQYDPHMIYFNTADNLIYLGDAVFGVSADDATKFNDAFESVSYDEATRTITFTQHDGTEDQIVTLPLASSSVAGLMSSTHYDAVETLTGADTVEGSVKKALKDAKAYADEKVNALDLAEVKEEGKAIIAVSQVDGQVSATAGDIAAAHVTVADANDKITATTVEAALEEIVDNLAAEAKTREDNDKAITDRLDVIEGEAEGSIKKAVADAKAAIEGELADTDAKTLAALNDRIDGVVADTKTYSVEALTADEIAALSDSANVKEAYKLVETVGENSVDKGDVIKIYKDSSLISVSLEAENAAGTKGQFLKYTYIKADGSEEVVYVNVSEFLVQAEFKNGLAVSEAGEVSVKIDSASESFLTVSEAGVKLAGVQAAINAAVEALDATVGSAEVAEGKHVAVQVVETDGVITAVNVAESDIASAEDLQDLVDLVGEAPTAGEGETVTVFGEIAKEAKAREDADKAINDTIGTVEEGKTVVGLIEEAKKAAIASGTVVVEGTDAGNNLEIASETAEDGHTTYTINLSNVASAQGLADEIDRATKAENTIEASVGLAEDGSHVATSGNYTKDATTIAGEIAALDAQVKVNDDELAVLNGDATTEGSVAKAAADTLASAQTYTDTALTWYEG